MTLRLRGMTGFTVVWAGQFISLLGTSITNFAETMWAWEQTGQATTLAPDPVVLLRPPELIRFL